MLAEEVSWPTSALVLARANLLESGVEAFAGLVVSTRRSNTAILFDPDTARDATAVHLRLTFHHVAIMFRLNESHTA